ncbi:hypothetical protein BJ508DRAFT_343811 [Ascobolus immersus RN42]|uniref:Uncharacterized protein n=1 Tax=Ascobolus immersus RN42 TaxID=1160509 RepID=A0A3N4HED1_ASCIM|nr:hypothetical protein BJ508DRAFT_343811 [Ascobolus immersus RN42]
MNHCRIFHLCVLSRSPNEFPNWKDFLTCSLIPFYLFLSRIYAQTSATPSFHTFYLNTFNMSRYCALTRPTTPTYHALTERIPIPIDPFLLSLDSMARAEANRQAQVKQAPDMDNPLIDHPTMPVYYQNPMILCQLTPGPDADSAAFLGPDGGSKPQAFAEPKNKPDFDEDLDDDINDGGNYDGFESDIEDSDSDSDDDAGSQSDKHLKPVKGEKYFGYNTYISPTDHAIKAQLHRNKVHIGKDASFPDWENLYSDSAAMRFIRRCIEPLSNAFHAQVLKFRDRNPGQDKKIFKLSTWRVVDLERVPGYEPEDNAPTGPRAASITFTRDEFLVLKAAAEIAQADEAFVPYGVANGSKRELVEAQKAAYSNVPSTPLGRYARLDRRLHTILNRLVKKEDLTEDEIAILKYGRVVRKAIAVCMYVRVAKGSKCIGAMKAGIAGRSRVKKQAILDSITRNGKRVTAPSLPNVLTEVLPPVLLEKPFVGLLEAESSEPRQRAILGGNKRRRSAPYRIEKSSGPGGGSSSRGARGSGNLRVSKSASFLKTSAGAAYHPSEPLPLQDAPRSRPISIPQAPVSSPYTFGPLYASSFSDGSSSSNSSGFASNANSFSVGSSSSSSSGFGSYGSSSISLSSVGPLPLPKLQDYDYAVASYQGQYQMPPPPMAAQSGWMVHQNAGQYYQTSHAGSMPASHGTTANTLLPNYQQGHPCTGTSTGITHSAQKHPALTPEVEMGRRDRSSRLASQRLR